MWNQPVFGMFGFGPIELAIVSAVLGLIFLAIGVAVGGFLWNAMRQKKSRPKAQPQSPLAIDVTQLPSHGPGNALPFVEVYGVPMRVVVVVLAPLGRVGKTPSAEQFLPLVDYIVPGLAEVFISHQPLVRIWPAQYSSQGFFMTFFNQIALPGEKGKGTPWCSVTGRVNHGEHSVLAGIVFCADQSNSLSHHTMANDSQWNDVVRVRKA